MSEKSMMLVSSSWSNSKTFKLIPVSEECPYNEVIFDPQQNVLALISKERKETLHMLPKLNEWGDPISMKIGKRNNGKDYAEQRVTLDTFYEYFLEERSDIEAFINYFAVNPSSFDYKAHLDAVPVPQPELQAPSIIVP